jgi:surfactin synthase thioesterase subunit
VTTFARVWQLTQRVSSSVFPSATDAEVLLEELVAAIVLAALLLVGLVLGAAVAVELADVQPVITKMHKIKSRVLIQNFLIFSPHRNKGYS